MRVIPVLVLAAVAAGVAAGRAEACKCARVDARSTLKQADGAFVGRLVETRFRGNEEAVHVFSVERSVKGRFGSPVEVVSPAQSASCGLGVGVGVRVGLFVERRDRELHSSLCWQVRPDELLDAALPLPAPDGRGPAALLVGGRSGDVRTMALDRRGSTLAYGRGRGTSVLLAACPGGRRSVEIAFDRGYRVGVRELPGLRLVREVPLRLGAVHSLCCGDANASRVQLFAGGQNGIGKARVVVVRPSGPRVVWRGRAAAASFDRLGRTAFVNAGADGTSLLAVRTSDGSSRRIASLPPWTGALAPSPNGTRLAGISAPPAGERTRLVHVRHGVVSTRAFPRSALGSVAWWGAKLVLAPREGAGPVLVLDRNLETVRRVGRWPASRTVLSGDRLLGTSSGRLHALDLPTGSTRTVRRLPSTLTNALAAVPERRAERAPSARREAAAAAALVLLVAIPVLFRRRGTPSGGGAAHPEG